MKKVLGVFMITISLFLLTGCTEDTPKTNEQGNKKTEFQFNETAIVNDTKIKLNSVKKVLRECLVEYDGSCLSEQTPENNFYLVVDLTIENTGSKDLSVSSIMSFEMKDTSGEKGKYALLTKSIQSQLDGTVLSNDLLKGQIAYDVKDSDKYYFYYTDNLVDSPVKFVINKSDITE